MIFIQMVGFIRNGFQEVCGGNKSKVGANFQNQCCLEISFPIDDKNGKEKNHKVSDAFKVVDNFFQLVFKSEKTLSLIDMIFNMWENISVKNQNIKKYESLTCNHSKKGLGNKNLPQEMVITP